MKKTVLLFILGAFLLGGVQGYFHLFPALKKDASPSATAKETRTDGRVSGFKHVRERRTGNQSLPSENSWGVFLLKYADLSTQETWAELERLLNVQKNRKRGDYILYQAIQYLSFKLAFQSPEEAKLILNDKSNKERSLLYSSLLEGWAEKDFQGAMDYLLAHKGESRDVIQTFCTLTTNLAYKDTDKALKWIASLTPGERQTALNTMVRDIPRMRPEKVAGLLAVLTREEQSSYSISSRLASNWAVSDWDAFKAWADTFEGNEQERILSEAFQGLSRTGLDKVTEKMKELGKKNSSEIAQSIVFGMGFEERSKGEALGWLMENRDYFSDLPSAMEEVTKASSLAGKPELTERVLKLPEGEIRDSALSGMIEGQSSSHWPNGASDKYANLLELTEKIGDQEKQNKVTLSCVECWIYQSPEEARKWITDKSRLSAEEKETLLKQCDSRQKEKNDDKD